MTARRRNDSSGEAAMKAAFAVIVLLALAIGGVGGFASTLLALVQLSVVCLIFGFAAFLIARSRLIGTKKIGLILMLAGLLGGGIWRSTRLPDMWPQAQATVLSITSPKISVQATYRYEVGRQLFSNYITTSEWRHLADAKKRTPATITLFYNPNNSDEVSEKRKAGWTKVEASLVEARPQNLGVHTGQLQVSGAFGFGRVLSVKGDFLEKLSPGSKVPIWNNPINHEEFSFEPRATVGGKNYPLLGVSIFAALVGLVLTLLKPKEWLLAESDLPDSEERLAEPEVDPRDRLKRIDWYQFEKVSARLLEADGWQVARRGGANPDGGADLVARRNGQTAVVQCKHWKTWNIDPKVMRELLGTKNSAEFTADMAILFTLSACSEEALKFAVANGISVYGEAEIMARISALGADRFPELLNPEIKHCPKCDAPMVFRGRFWGCSNYGKLRCRGKIEA